MAPIVTMVGPKTPGGKEATAAEVLQNIKVFVRCRPLKGNEKKNVIDVISDRKEVRINESKNSNERYNTKTFTFDNAFHSETTQLEVYRSVVEPLIEQVVMGYNCTVFAYGQTGTGKTYTMEGERSKDDNCCSWEEDPMAGIIPRALHQLFEALQIENTEHTVRVSFLELYNEELYDLLSPLDDTTKLKIFEDATRKGSIIVGGLEEFTVHSKAEIYEILKKGSAKRQTAATLLNACSSRSHTIFSVTVHIKENAIDGEDLVKIGKLNLVDLAGSENIGRSGAIDKRAREAGNINQSLLTLGRVITSLVDRTPHIPYRESKLTRLLQESLGGRTKTSIIATISPNIADADDTLSTLEYAQRAKKITNKPEINQKMSKKTLLREYTAEIERLRRDLAACREKNGIYVDQENFTQMEQQIKDQMQDIEEKTAQIQALSEEILRVQALFEETKEELESTADNLKTTSNKLTETARSLNITRNDRDEQKLLVEAHVNSEKVLSSQAKQLLGVAEVSTSAVGKLHEKVDRQKNVETNNWTKTQEFKAKFVEEMKHLENLVGITTESYNDSCIEMKEAVKSSITSVEAIAKEAQNKVLSLNEVWSQSKAEFSTIFTKDRLVLEQCLSMKDSNQQIQTAGDHLFAKILSCLESAQKAIFEDIEKINQIVAQQRQDVEDLVMRQNTQIERISKITAKSFEATKKDLETVFDRQNEEMSSIVAQLESVNGTNAAKHEAIDQLIDEFETDMKSQLQKLSDIKVRRIKARVESEKSSQEMSSRLKQTSDTRQNSLAELNSKFEAFVIEMDCEEKAGLKLVATIDELNTDKTQQLMNTLNELNTKNTSLPNEMKDMVTECKELLAKQSSEVIGLVDDTIKNCDKQLTSKQTALKSVDCRLLERLEEQKNVVNDIVSNVRQTDNIVFEKTSEMTRLVETMDKSQKREIRSRVNSFESFVTNELIQDMPTGTTPQKTTYSFPRELVQTSPHERILDRYRLAKASTCPLPEDSESDILSDSSSSLKSLDSFQSNDENLKPLTDYQKRKKVGLNGKQRTKEISPRDTPTVTDKRSNIAKPLATNLNQ